MLLHIMLKNIKREQIKQMAHNKKLKINFALMEAQ